MHKNSDNAEIYLKFQSFAEKFIRKLSAENWMQLMLHFSSSNQHFDAMQGILGQRGHKVTQALWKNLFFFFFSPKTRWRKIFGRRNFRAPANYDVASSTKQWTNKFYKCVGRKRVSNVRKELNIGECQIFFKKNSKVSDFWRKLTEKCFFFGLKLSQHAAQQNGVPSISAKTLVFLSSQWGQDSKIFGGQIFSASEFLAKKMKTDFFRGLVLLCGTSLA